MTYGVVDLFCGVGGLDVVARYGVDVSQEQFADKEGLGRTISLDNIQKIAEALEIKTYLLFIDDGDKKDVKKAGGK